ncbi:MAG: nucleotidyltransferase domain-containing protein [Deltaproteobacteria bacterium]|nr:nucleotidyltransferase domain-containing protein [Deltaproteobacteria bacterium]
MYGTLTLPSHLTEAEAVALNDFVSAVRTSLGSLLQSIILFGSRARGQGHQESDLDIAIIVAAGGRLQRRLVQDLAFDIHLRTGIDIAPLVIEEPYLNEMRLRERSLAYALDHEGILL